MSEPGLAPDVAAVLHRGVVIPAHPLALTAGGSLDEAAQRGLTRYYVEAGSGGAGGSGGLAVGVHTTQFAIRRPEVGLFRPVLELAKEEMDAAEAAGRTRTGEPLVRIGGVCGRTAQAVAEAELLRELGYHAGLVSLAAFGGDAAEEEMLAHCRAVGRVLPLVGFYLQEAVGGPRLSQRFWRALAEEPSVVAIKVAPFNRYRTLDVLRAVADARHDRDQPIALYTGNDDNILFDLLTPYRLRDSRGEAVELRFVGGLLGQWAVWTRRAVQMLERCHELAAEGGSIPPEMLTLAAELTDANAAIFDAANDFGGCIAGVHEVLRREGLMPGIRCLDPAETLGPGQAAEIDRVWQAYPHLRDPSD